MLYTVKNSPSDQFFFRWFSRPNQIVADRWYARCCHEMQGQVALKNEQWFILSLCSVKNAGRLTKWTTSLIKEHKYNWSNILFQFTFKDLWDNGNLWTRPKGLMNSRSYLLFAGFAFVAVILLCFLIIPQRIVRDQKKKKKNLVNKLTYLATFPLTTM